MVQEEGSRGSKTAATTLMRYGGKLSPKQGNQEMAGTRRHQRGRATFGNHSFHPASSRLCRFMMSLCRYAQATNQARRNHALR